MTLWFRYTTEYDPDTYQDIATVGDLEDVVDGVPNISPKAPFKPYGGGASDYWAAQTGQEKRADGSLYYDGKGGTSLWGAWECPGKMPEGIRIRLPGGELRYEFKQLSDFIGDAAAEFQKIITQAMQWVSYAMAALGPIMTIIEFIQEIVHCITVFADGDPDEIAQCAADLADKLITILGNLFPAFSIPPMILDITCVIARVIEVFINYAEEIYQGILSLDRLKDLIPTLPHLTDKYVAMECLLETKKDGFGQLLGFLNPFIDTANSFAELAGEELIPTLGDLDLSDIQKVRAQLLAFKDQLGIVPDTCVLSSGDVRVTGGGGTP